MNKSSTPSRFAIAFAVVSVGSTLLLWQPERTKVADAPLPTPKRVLDRLQELGATWELNRHGQVVFLNLKRLPLSDDDLRILHALPELRTLNMRGIHDKEGNTLTDEGIKHLVGLKKLRKLELSANYHLTDVVSFWLKKLTNLRWLSISQTEMTEASLPNLSRLRRLEEFHTNGFSLTEETVEHFEKMRLKQVTFRVPDESLPLLPRLTHLKSYPSLFQRTIKDRDLQYLTHLDGVEMLTMELVDGWSNASNLKYLQEWPRLEKLWIQVPHEPQTEVDREGIAQLANVKSLERLYPGKPNDAVLDALSVCQQIKLIELNSPAKDLTPRGVRSLKSMSGLKGLSLDRELVTDEFLEAISEIESLEVLALDERSLYAPGWIYSLDTESTRRFTLKGLEQLARLPRLKVLLLDGWDLGGEIMASLAKMKSLEMISIQSGHDYQTGPVISDAGLLQLRNLPNLTYLNFCGTRTSMVAAEQLSELLPELYIEDNWCCGCMCIGPRPKWAWTSEMGISY